VAILKTLGASRRKVAAIFSVEFLILGAVAGLLGGLLATGFSNLLLVKLLEAKARIDWVPNAVAIVLSAVIANVAGWLASARTLDQTPLAALRDE
jgi:putative ABC transport system permease protein